MTLAILVMSREPSCSPSPLLPSPLLSRPMRLGLLYQYLSFGPYNRRLARKACRQTSPDTCLILALALAIPASPQDSDAVD
jgi:hypothetical protein